MENLSGGKGDFDLGTVVGDRAAMICRASESNSDGTGIYLFRRVGGAWQSRPLLRDEESGRKWRYCVWGTREKGGFSLVAKAEEEQQGECPATSYWSLTLSDAEEPELRRIARFAELVSGESVSPDGKLLAVVRRRRQIRRRLALISLDPAAPSVKDIDCGRKVIFPNFNPSGDQLLLWYPGTLRTDPEWGLAELLTVDVANLSIAEVPIPSALEGLAQLCSVDWFPEDSLAMGIEDYGVARLDLSTGEAHTLRRVPLRGNFGASGDAE